MQELLPRRRNEDLGFSLTLLVELTSEDPQILLTADVFDQVWCDRQARVPVERRNLPLVPRDPH